MIWTSWQEFVAMGGYGGYVWGSMGVAAGSLALEVAILRLRAKSIAQSHGVGGTSDFTGMTDENTA